MGGKTSTASKARWMKENYTSFHFWVNKEDGLAFKEKCKREGYSQAEILKQAVYDYIGKPVPPSKARF